MMNETTLNTILAIEYQNTKNIVKKNNSSSNYRGSHEMDIDLYYLICGATEKEKSTFNEKNSEFIRLYK